MKQTCLDMRPPDLATARATGQAAQQLAADRAERDLPGFSELAKAAILERLAIGPASGEDLTDHVASVGIAFKDGRALGPIYANLRRRGLIEVCGACLRRKGHAGAGGRLWRLVR